MERPLSGDGVDAVHDGATNGHDPATYLTNCLTAYAANGHQPLSEADLAAFLPPAHSADPAVVNAASAAQ